jgi:hypothetical protein
VLTAEDESEDRVQDTCTDLDLQCAPPDDWVLEGKTACAAAGATEDEGGRVELYNSGATRHVTPFKSDFISYSPLNLPTFLNTANQQRFPAIGTGTLATIVPCNGQSTKLLLRDLSGLRIWGCPVLAHDADGSKLEPRAREARWLGFDVEMRAHRGYWPGPGNVPSSETSILGRQQRSRGRD